MSNLIEQLFAMDERRGGDAIILQPIDKTGNSQPVYWRADAIVRRIKTHDGYQWAFHTLIMGKTGSGQYFHDLNDLVTSVERQFGTKSEVREWIVVDYTDSDFPVNLLPF